MKKLKTIISVCFLCSLLTNCENNEGTNIPSNSLEGTWHVTTYITSFLPHKNYKKGTFTWTFDLKNKTVTIVNIADIFNALDVPSFTNNQGGTYSFEIIEENSINFLVVGDRKGHIDFSDTGLTIDYGIAVDDVAYKFIR